MNKAIAISLINQISSQSELLMGLSTAICSGIFILFLQIYIHNFDPGKSKVIFRNFMFLIIAFFFEGLSLVFAYLLHGSIVSVTPAIFKHANPDVANWTHVPFDGAINIRCLAVGQFLFFITGVFLILIFVFMNRHQMMNGEQ